MLVHQILETKHSQPPPLAPIAGWTLTKSINRRWWPIINLLQIDADNFPHMLRKVKFAF